MYLPGRSNAGTFSCVFWTGCCRSGSSSIETGTRRHRFSSPMKTPSRSSPRPSGPPRRWSRLPPPTGRRSPARAAARRRSPEVAEPGIARNVARALPRGPQRREQPPNFAADAHLNLTCASLASFVGSGAGGHAYASVPSSPLPSSPSPKSRPSRYHLAILSRSHEADERYELRRLLRSSWAGDGSGGTVQPCFLFDPTPPHGGCMTVPSKQPSKSKDRWRLYQSTMASPNITLLPPGPESKISLISTAFSFSVDWPIIFLSLRTLSSQVGIMRAGGERASAGLSSAPGAPGLKARSEADSAIIIDTWCPNY